MIKLNLDTCTMRRISGWIFDMETLKPVDGEVYLESSSKKVKVDFIDRNDVAEAFALKQTNVGIEINIPDAFDGLISDYRLLYKNQEIFSYQSQYLRLADLDHTASAVARRNLSESYEADYERGRHIIFLYDSDPIKSFLETLSQPMIRRSFPTKIAGCEFSSMNINTIDKCKKEIIGNLENILIVIPSALYEKLNRISPAIITSVKFVTLFSDGGLYSRTGLHGHQLNNFILKKTREEESLPLYKASIIRIWEAIENYADIIFSTNKNLFFIISESSTSDPGLNQYISNKIQNKRNEDIIRIKKNNVELILLNISAYCKLFDKIGSNDCWNAGIARGLKHVDMVI